MRNINFENINVLPILDIDKNVDPEKLINALIDGKINTVEITLRNEKAFDNIKFIRKKFPNLILGVGTIVNLDQLKKAIDLGADFGISPGFETEILKYAQENKFSYIPGVSTASEIISCLKFDCNFLKLFPAEPLGGISYLNSLSGPFPNVSFCPTGGINSGNYLSWLSQKVDLSYDWYENLMISREKHTEWLAELTIQKSIEKQMEIFILGKSFKKETNLVNGSPAYLLKNLIEEKNHKTKIYDPFIDSKVEEFNEPSVFFIATNHDVFKDINFPAGSVVIDPWRMIDQQERVELISIGVS